MPKSFNLVQKNSIYWQRRTKISTEKIQKITNRVDWILIKRVCDVLLCLLLRLKSSLYGQLPDYVSHVLALIYPVGEFLFKEMKRWVQSKISSCCFMFGANQENQEAVWSSGFSFVIPVVRILFLSKILEREGSISPSSFYGQLPDC